MLLNQPSPVSTPRIKLRFNCIRSSYCCKHLVVGKETFIDHMNLRRRESDVRGGIMYYEGGRYVIPGAPIVVAVGGSGYRNSAVGYDTMTPRGVW